MNNCISYSPRASLAIVGMNVRQMGIWDMIGQQVNIQQKTVVHTPLQKLQDAFINMMAGGHGIVEVNQRLKPDPTLSAAFGRQSCADQSGISATLNACRAENVAQMRQAMQAIYRRYGAGYRHDYGRSWQLLDIDVSGMPAGRQGEGVEKGARAHAGAAAMRRGEEKDMRTLSNRRRCLPPTGARAVRHTDKDNAAPAWLAYGAATVCQLKSVRGGRVRVRVPLWPPRCGRLPPAAAHAPAGAGVARLLPVLGAVRCGWRTRGSPCPSHPFPPGPRRFAPAV